MIVQPNSISSNLSSLVGAEPRSSDLELQPFEDDVDDEEEILHPELREDNKGLGSSKTALTVTDRHARL